MRLGLLAAFVLLPFAAFAAEFYCDPVSGDTLRGDGSSKKPFGTLESVVKAGVINTSDPTKGKIRAGDVVRLRTGDHGSVNMQGPAYTATTMTTIEADDGHVPILRKFDVGSAANTVRNWTFRGFSVMSPDQALEKWFVVSRMTNLDTVVIDGVSFRTEADATKWGFPEWETRCPFYGLNLKGRNVIVRKCVFYGLENCIFVDGDTIDVDDNSISYFINDGIEHTARNLRIRRNRITDLFDLPSNGFHHDGIQGWNFASEPIRNVLIEGNYIAYSSGKYPTIPTPGAGAIFQGIVFFDGSWADVIVRNNTVIITGFQGISIYRATDCVIENNTLLYQGPKREQGPPWIGVFSSAKNVVLRRNIAPLYNLLPDGVIAEDCFAFQASQRPWDKSFTIIDPVKTFYFYDASKGLFDVGIRPESPAADRDVIVRKIGAGSRF